MASHRMVALLTLLLALTTTSLASTTWYVDGVNGNDKNNCLSPTTACKTIGHAISLASSGDSIEVAAATYKENLTIKESLTITGSGAMTTIVDGGHRKAVFTIANQTVVGLSDLTIQNGYAELLNGAGISNSGTLTVTNSSVNGNHAVPICQKGGCSGGLGGGIYNTGTLTVNNSTVSGNRADGGCSDTYGCYGGSGGGIYNGSGMLIITNTTISGNIANSPRGHGGGISNQATLTINNSTLSGNSATAPGGNISGPATIQNSILANATKGGNCSGTMTSEGYNLSDDNTCNFNGPGDLNDTDPMLGPLQNNGGPTATMALPSGSPAIDAGNPNGCTDGNGNLLTTDQRGYPRPGAQKHDKRCDMGAYESQTD